MLKKRIKFINFGRKTVVFVDWGNVIRDRLWFGPQHNTGSFDEPELLVYFVPGNPCLVAYYDRFLASLSKQLKVDSDGKELTALVGGYSLPGFQLSRPAIMKGTLPAGLEEQILNVELLLLQALETHFSSDSSHNGRRGTKVVLIAHSVGAYMTLEVLRRRAMQLNGLQAVDIIGAVLLFPTVTEIAESQNGRTLKTLLRIPYFLAIVVRFIHIVTYFISMPILAWVVCLVGRVPDHVGKAAAQFLKSPMGVFQALHLTLDEMKIIREDRWDETVWGSSHSDSKPQSGAVPLRFYFGEQDVWVSSKRRDELIASRARRGSDGPESRKPVMVIDRENIPHEFVVGHSEKIAEKAKAMIDDLREVERIKSYKKGWSLL